jgi:hypothetical protein
MCDIQEILFQRRVIIKEKKVTIPPIKTKVKIGRKCNERPSKVRHYTESELYLENVKRLNRPLMWEV